MFCSRSEHPSHQHVHHHMYHHYPSDSASPPPHQVHVSIGVSGNSLIQNNRVLFEFQIEYFVNVYTSSLENRFGTCKSTK